MQHVRPREVWFIRHAESVANAGGRTKEAPTYPLTELGFRQAEQLGRVLPGAAELVVVSPYVRARQTAEAFLRRWPAVQVEEWPVYEVQYLDPALCVDTTQEERRVLSETYWERCDCDYAAPNAESFVAFVKRAQDALNALARRSEGQTYIFTHGQFMSAVARLILTRPARIDASAMRRFHDFVHGYAVPNCAMLPVYMNDREELSSGGLRVLNGVDVPAADLARAGLAGL